MTLPNFLVIGAGKSGTTSLYRYLKQHPAIYMSSRKEPNFFAIEGEKPNFQGPSDDKGVNRWSVTDIDSYTALFDGVTNEKAFGEASPLYLYSPKAPGRIKHYIPDAKLIAVLRNPVERTYSNYTFSRGNGYEVIADFADALRAEEDRINKNWPWIWHYKNLGFYYKQLKRYYDIFDGSQIKIFLYEDYKSNNLGVLQEIFRFLGVDDAFVPDVSKKHHVTRHPRSKRLDAFVTQSSNPLRSFIKQFCPVGLRDKMRGHTIGNLRKWNYCTKKPPIPEEARRQLIEDYREDILSLQNLINRNLSAWLK